MMYNSLKLCSFLSPDRTTTNKNANNNSSNNKTVAQSILSSAYPYFYEIESESFCSEDEISSQASVDRYSLMGVSNTQSPGEQGGKSNTDAFISQMYLGDRFLSANGMRRVDIATGRSVLALGKIGIAHQAVEQLTAPAQQKSCWIRRKQERAAIQEKLKRSDGLLNEMRYAEQGIQIWLHQSREECLTLFTDCALRGDIESFKDAAIKGKEHLCFLNEMAQEARDKQRSAARSVDQMDAKTSQRWFSSIQGNGLFSRCGKKSKKQAKDTWMQGRLRDIHTQLSHLRRKSDDLESMLDRLIDGASPEERALYKIAQRSLAQDILALADIDLDVDKLRANVQNHNVMDSFSRREMMLHKNIMSASANLDATELMLLGLTRVHRIKCDS